jgi:membrane protease YdiL (CAAX protease family)
MTTDIVATPPAPPLPFVPAADPSFDSAKARMTRRGIRARPIVDDALRSLLGWETLLVLAIFPLPATVTALADLASHWSPESVLSRGDAILPNQPFLSLVFELGFEAIALAGAGIGLYLLVRTGEGIGAIGLGGRRLRMDLALVMPVWVFAQWIPQAMGRGLVVAWHLTTFYPPSSGVRSDYLVLGLVASLVAGVLEEIVVLGYLVRRLEQRGWAVPVVVAVAVAVRVSYHLYYGPGVVPIVLWATASVLLYLKLRRLLPFIVCHVAWDIQVTVGVHANSSGLAFSGLFFLLSIALTAVWRNWHPARPVSEAGFSSLR